MPMSLEAADISVVMKADPEDVSEVVRFPEDAIVTVVVLLDVVLIDDPVGGATRSCGTCIGGHRGRQVTKKPGARVPKETFQK